MHMRARGIDRSKIEIKSLGIHNAACNAVAL